MKEYGWPKNLSRFIYLILLLAIPLFGWMIVFPFFEEPINWNFAFVFCPLALGMSIFLLMSLWDIKQAKLIIEQDRLSYFSVFGNKMLLFSEIKGYRLVQGNILIEPILPKNKRMKISTSFGHVEDLLHWLSKHYPDIDLLNQQIEEKELLENAEFGRTVEERDDNVKRAHSLARLLTAFGVCMALWGLFNPHPYEYALLSNICVMLFVLTLLKMGKFFRLGLRTRMPILP